MEVSLDVMGTNINLRNFLWLRWMTIVKNLFSGKIVCLIIFPWICIYIFIENYIRVITTDAWVKTQSSPP